jgi:DNA polymerase III delta subunit
MIILHGENQVASRAAFLQAKQAGIKKGLTTYELPGDDLTLDVLVQAVETESLFGSINQVVIEGFFSRRPSNEKKKVTEYLESQQEREIITWDGKDVTTHVKNFTNVKKFDLPKTIFKYLDTFAISDLNQTLENTAPELIFTLLAGQVRKLIMVKDGAINLPAWQMGKLKQQAAKYSMEKLLKMHAGLLELDYKSKTSGSALDMAGQLQLWTLRLS